MYEVLLIQTDNRYLLLFTLKKFKEYNNASSIKQLQMPKDNRFRSIYLSRHSQTYKSEFVANVFKIFLDPSLNAWLLHKNRGGFKQPSS